MGQKVNPNGMRVGIINNWSGIWFAGKKDFSKTFLSDLKIRNFLKENLKNAGITKVEISRNNQIISIAIFSSKPGVIIGRSGSSIEELKQKLSKKFNENFDVSIHEVKNPDLEAAILTDFVAQQLEKRIPFRRAAKMALKRSMESGAKGVKISVAGRLGGVDIARNEFFSEGKIPLHTFRADISYNYRQAKTTYGVIGVKAWVFRGEIFEDRLRKKIKT